MNLKLDIIDRRILYELDKDARAPVNTIAKKIRRSKQFVEYRIKKMTDAKVILGYNTLVDITTLGYHAFRINLRLKSMTEEERQDMIRQMIADPETWWYGHSEGAWNVCYAMAVRDPDLFNAYWERVLRRHGHLFLDYAIIYYRNLRWYPSKFLTDDRNNALEISVLSRNAVKIDDTDRKILRAISRKARFTFLDLEDVLGLSRETIKRRIAEMETKGVIVGYKLWFDEKLLGYRFYKAYLKLKSWNNYKELFEYCRRNPNIVTVNKTIGGADFEIELKAKEIQHFESLMDTLIVTFPGLIDSYEFVLFRTEDKMTFLPEDF